MRIYSPGGANELIHEIKVRVFMLAICGQKESIRSCYRNMKQSGLWKTLKNRHWFNKFVQGRIGGPLELQWFGNSNMNHIGNLVTPQELYPYFNHKFEIFN